MSKLDQVTEIFVNGSYGRLERALSSSYPPMVIWARDEIKKYTELILWYLTELCLRPRHGKVWLEQWGLIVTTWYNRTNPVKCTRTQLATALGDQLAKKDAIQMTILCVLPQPIADEILPEIFMGDSTLKLLRNMI